MSLALAGDRLIEMKFKLRRVVMRNTRIMILGILVTIMVIDSRIEQAVMNPQHLRVNSLASLKARDNRPYPRMLT